MGNNIVAALPHKRNTSLDIVRVIAIFAVVMVHSSARFVTGCEPYTIGFIWGNIFNSISRAGVPLFVMISGALLLDEQKPFSNKDLFKRRIPQLAVLLVIWSLIYAIRYEIILPLTRGNLIDWKSFFVGFICGHYHLWYLYMIIGLYMALPFLREIVCKKNKDLVLMYLGISLVFQFLVPILKILSVNFEFPAFIIMFFKKFQLGFFNAFVSYFLAGWYIVHIGVPKKKRIALYCMGILSVLIMLLFVFIMKSYKNVYSNAGILVFLYSIGIFIAVNNGKKQTDSGKIISFLSKYSFGVYIVHIFFLDFIKRQLPKTLIAPVYILICWVLTFVVSLLVTFILSKIPLLKKLVRG